MQKILVLGAGKSSSVLLKYLAVRAEKYHYKLIVADESPENLALRTNSLPNTEAICSNIANSEILNNLVQASSIVISLLPPFLHLTIAKLCINHKKSLLTASYVSPEINNLHADVLRNHLTFLMECGLDPGIDHMSAMKVLDDLRSKGADIYSFRSYCGGLVAPESDTNPWGYKVSWNPRNVVLAGKGTAQFLEKGDVKFIPYHHLFNRTETIVFDDYGEYEAYPNRDSLSYIPLYKLEKAQTFLRGTIRKKGFCKAWNAIVSLGLTDDTVYLNAHDLNISELVTKFLPPNVSLAEYLRLEETSEEYQKLRWLGLLSKEILHQKGRISPADCLQEIIERKWKLQELDRDLVLMQHQIEYNLENKQHKLVSSLSLEGKDAVNTAMATTVGLPLAIATLMVLTGKINERGVVTPVLREIYNPILEELKNNSLIFREYTYS